MLNVDTEILLKLPNKTSKASLYAARIMHITDGIYTVGFNHRDAVLAPGVEILIYFELDQVFMEQPACIETVIEQTEYMTVTFRTIGQPVSGERRRCYRVPTLISDLTVTFNNEENCPLINISATGLTIISKNNYREGYVAPITLYFENNEYPGKACVQSMRKLADGRNRYGLLGLEDRATGNRLLKGMQKISMAVQRKQLRRQSAVS